jgi:hypothetical protein
MKTKKLLLKLSATALIIASILPFHAFASNDQQVIKNDHIIKNEKLLKDRGVKESDVAILGSEVNTLANEISVNRLSDEQISNFIDGVKKADEQNKKVERNRKAGIVDESEQYTREVINGMVTLPNGKQIPVPQNDKVKSPAPKTASNMVSALAVLGHGPYYNVDAKIGYNQITAMVDLPLVKSTTPSGIIPYVLGGAYVSTDNVNYDGGADVGAYYENGSWYLAINGKNKANTANYWTSSTASLPGSTVYLNYKVSANNQLQITASDANYNYITSISYYFPDIYLKADGSNVEMATGFSMAYKTVKSISDGSYLLNGRFRNTYVYKPTGYSLMNSTTVAHANIKGTYDEQQKVKVTTNSYYYDYYCSIDLR